MSVEENVIRKPLFKRKEKKEKTDEEKSERETWSRPIELTLTLVGYSVGLNVIWRFPYVCMRNGGGVFLIPYFTCMLICGFPLYFLELAVGQYIGRSAFSAWSFCPLFKGVGYGMWALSVVSLFSSNMYIGLTLRYLVACFARSLPWSACTNSWNTPRCRQAESLGGSGLNLTTQNHTEDPRALSMSANTNASESGPSGSDMTSPAAEFWMYEVFGKDGSFENIGAPRWEMLLCFAGAWLLCFLCNIKGVKSVGKVVYVTAILPFFLLTFILIRAGILPGAREGILFYITPDFSKLFTVQVWVDGFSQVLYSLGPGWGGLITFGSYSKFHNNCYRDALIGTLAVSFTSVYGGLVVFSLLGFWAQLIELDISQLRNYGPGLNYVTYPEALTGLPLKQLWSVLFFINFLTVAVDSVFGVLETAVSGVLDLFPRLRKRRILVIGLMSFGYFLTYLPYSTPGGAYVFYLMDTYNALLCLPIITLGECIVIGWFLGAHRFGCCVNAMIGFRPSVFLRICWCCLIPILTVVLFFVAVTSYKTPAFGDYHYPAWAELVGISVALLPVLPVPVMMIVQILRVKGSLLERLKTSVEIKERCWPSLEDDPESIGFTTQTKDGEMSLWQKIKIRISG